MKRRNADAAARAGAAIAAAERLLQLTDHRVGLLAHARHEYACGNYAQAAREARKITEKGTGT